MTAVAGARQRTYAPKRVSAWGRGVWTLAEASVECRVMSGATAASARKTSNAEQRECAGGRHNGNVDQRFLQFPIPSIERSLAWIHTEWIHDPSIRRADARY